MSLGLGLGLGNGALRTIPQRVRSILAKYGSDAHVYLPGAPVPVLGPNLVTNGSFDTDTAGWINFPVQWVRNANGTITGTATGVSAYIKATSGLFENGKTYCIEFDVLARTGTTQPPIFFGSNCNIQAGPTPVGKFSKIVTVSGAVDAFLWIGIPGTDSITLDNISVREVVSYRDVIDGFTAGNFQLSTGTAAVVDQPVGLALDAEGSLGPELVVNGGFDSATGWAVVPNTQTATVSGGVLTLITTDGTNCYAQQSGSTQANKTYLVTAVVNSASGYGAGVQLGGSSTGQNVLSFNSAGTFSGCLVAADNTIQVKRNPGEAASAVIDSISVREVTGIHATQTTSGFRPTLRRGAVNLLTQSNAFTTSWTSTQLTITQTGDSPVAPAWSVIDTGAGASTLAQMITASAGATVTHSRYVKKGNQNFIRLVAASPGGNGYQSWFNLALGSKLTNGVLGTGSGSANIVDVGSGWYRISVTATIGAADTGISVNCYVTNADASTTRVANSEYFTSAAQLETGSTASDYSPTTTVAASNPSAGRYAWQFDGTDDRLALGSVPFQPQDDFALILGAYAQYDAAINRRIFGSQGATAAIDILINASSGVLSGKIVGDTGVTAWPGSQLVSSFDQNFVCSLIKRGIEKRCRRNGVSGGVDNTVINGGVITAATIGAVGSASVNFYKGFVYPTIAIKGTVSDADLKTLEKWVGKLSGVTI